MLGHVPFTTAFKPSCPRHDLAAACTPMHVFVHYVGEPCKRFAHQHALHARDLGLH